VAQAKPFLYNMSADNKNDPWWGPALEIFGRISAWVVIPIVLALIIGKKLDAHYETKPWIFLGLTLFGFLISSFGIVHTVKIYMRKIDRSTDSGQEKNDNSNNQK